MTAYKPLPPEDPNKHCASCGAILPTPLSEFGDMREPVCQKCFLDPDTLIGDERKYKSELEEELAHISAVLSRRNISRETRDLFKLDRDGALNAMKEIRTLPHHKEELAALDRWKAAVLA